MKFRRMVIECGLLTAVLAIGSVTTAVSVSAAETNDETVTEQDSSMAGNGNEIAADTATVDAEDSEWADQLIVNVDDKVSLNVRSGAGTEYEIVGKMYRGYGATVEEVGEEWTKIKSGNVEGYVKNEYCLFGNDAKAFAEENCELEATSTANGLRIRSEANTDCKIYSALNKGKSLVVNEDADTVDGWIAVKYGDTTAYVSADYVEVSLDIETAKTMDEVAVTGSAVSASSDDVTLLAAIIQCEAGGECYEGKLAVGAVVVNRVKSSSFPNTISGVIYQSGQFSPAGSGKLSRVLSSGNISSDCYTAAQAALSGQDNTGGCKYFHAGTRGSGTVIGHQIFY